MSEASPSELRVKDPLSEVTRRERKYLLGISVIAFAITKTGLLPTKVSALGIDFEKTDQSSLVLMITMIILYFFVAFIIYAFSDFWAWKIAISAAHISALKKERELRRAESGRVGIAREDDMDNMIHKASESAWIYYRTSGLISFGRVALDIFAPIIFAIYALTTSYSFSSQLRLHKPKGPPAIISDTTSVKNNLGSPSFSPDSSSK